ncbi:3-hydroxyacyl-CoA dehydrogenase [Paraburkholderia sp. BL27I4N3]|uniref:3-hydroxyacyl-CoA dehydrogenase NAD-binding domain-containing protein n=1 Tax=Paraburkholderia sp. BL27I4N3 TaxID=1938805 RepID=UPI000E253E87|nr:3-hydroxyacyl-CoA dehydrogenase NAD-binding domain-containing protein [Paraburkholderia sp. BL27I4N3]REE07101.1 3-hydroxyacyl-CoA dehydrogenase [Paraburkholderia sp. BL27I4N3]
MLVNYEVTESVAVLTMQQAPVNGLGLPLRKALREMLHKAFDDATIKGVVLTGGEKVFSAGADIEEFEAGLDGPNFADPYLGSLVDLVEAAGKPVVAAISGVCLGGGLELVLGCHYRVADSSARFGLPEVNLGILPGAGGTQRLPRLIGVEGALDLIVSGEMVDCERAVSLGLIDRVLVDEAEGTAVKKAVQLALEAASSGHWPRLRDVVIRMQANELSQLIEAKIATLRKPLPAALQCIDAVSWSVTLPFEEALGKEYAALRELMASAESQALRHAFFAERRAGKIQGISREVPVRAVTSVAVIGAGTMGSGIAMCCANAGMPVMLLDTSEEAVQRGLQGLAANYGAAIKRGRLTTEVADRRLRLISGSTDFSRIGSADLVIEAVYEDMAVKESVFRAIDSFAQPDAILASNTSTLDLDAIAGFTSRPQDVVGLHFFSPANLMRLLEVVRGAKTRDEVLASAMQFARKIGKVGVVAGVCDGFIGNRMFEEYLRQAYFLLDEGATPLQVDRALEDWGMAMGPLATMDLAGNDIGLAIRKRRKIEQPDRPYSAIPDLVAEMGRFGQKTGAGWYRYDPVTRKRQADPEIDSLVLEYGARNHIARREISDEEIVARCLFALANEGALILREGIAQRASDIDTVYLNGYGFPAHRGGPMFYADKIGLPNVLARIEGFQAGYMGELWQPASLLTELGETGQSFASV